jgi:hypothetical protein
MSTLKFAKKMPGVGPCSLAEVTEGNPKGCLRRNFQKKGWGYISQTCRPRPQNRGSYPFHCHTDYFGNSP